MQGKLLFTHIYTHHTHTISHIISFSPTHTHPHSIFAYVLKLERLTWVKAGGILLAVSGAFVVLRPDQMDFGQPTDMTAGVFVMILQVPTDLD